MAKQTQQPEQPLVVNEVIIKGERLKTLKAYIDELPHKIGRDLEGFLSQVAKENLDEKDKIID